MRRLGAVFAALLPAMFCALLTAAIFALLTAVICALLTAASVVAGERSALELKPVAILADHFYDGPLHSPRGVFADAVRGEVWVADTGNDLLSAFTADAMETFACRSGGVREPIRIAVDASGRLLVLGGQRTAIAVLNSRGERVGDLELPGLPKNAVIGTIATDREGFLYVGDNESGQVFVYDKDFKLKLKFGERGSGQGDFQSISGIAADAENIFVVDQQGTPSIQVFDRHGDFVRGWGKHDMGVDNFSLPEGIALDARGRVVVVDALRHEIKLFDREGKFIDRFGGLGKRLGQIAFPSGVAVDAQGRIFVAERGNNRVQVFEEIGGAPAGSDRP
jgi:DNA-binding beta-propeller fold protein YncE